MSCVMANRLCLNVRGMLSQTNEDFLDQVKPPPSMDGRLGLQLYSGHHQGPPGTNVVVFANSDGTVLSDMEMDELRHMRAAKVPHV